MTESVVYIGWPTILLSIIGTWRAWDRHLDSRMWAVVAFLASLFSRGPVLKMAGQVITVGGERFVILPYFLLTKVPFLSWGRTPARLHFTAMFALAILAAYGTMYFAFKETTGRCRRVDPVSHSI